MPLMSTFAPPSGEDAARIHDLATAVRCFDRNGGAHFMLPDYDPHGRRWGELSEDELREVAGWCMQPEYHLRLKLERQHRAGELGCQPQYLSWIVAYFNRR